MNTEELRRKLETDYRRINAVRPKGGLVTPKGERWELGLEVAYLRHTKNDADWATLINNLIHLVLEWKTFRHKERPDEIKGKLGRWITDELQAYIDFREEQSE